MDQVTRQHTSSAVSAPTWVSQPPMFGWMWCTLYCPFSGSALRLQVLHAAALARPFFAITLITGADAGCAPPRT